MRGGAEEVAYAQRYAAGEVSDARRYQTRPAVGIPRGRYQMHGGIPRGGYQTRGGEASDARRYPAGKVYIRYPAGEVSDARRYPAGGVSDARGGGIRRAEVSRGEGIYQTRGGIRRARGIPRGRHPAGEVSDARRYPAGEVSDARRGPGNPLSLPGGIRRAEVSVRRAELREAYAKGGGGGRAGG